MRNQFLHIIFKYTWIFAVFAGITGNTSADGTYERHRSDKFRVPLLFAPEIKASARTEVVPLS